MSATQNRTNPIVAIAAVSIIIFSAIGIGVMTGVIPNSFSKNSEPQAAGKAGTPKTGPVSSAPTAAKKVSAAPAAANEPVRIASAPRSCANCGRVEAVNAIQQKGEGSGLGAIAGGVVGGILGNQVGGGTGRTVATVAGAGAGAYAGHEIEKNVNKTQRYDVVVRLEDGTSRTFPHQAEPAFRPGDKVRIVDGTLVAN